MDWGTVIGVLGGAAGLLTAANALRKTNVEDRAGTITGLQQLVQTYRSEIDRMKVELVESEQECDRKIGAVKRDLESAKTTIIAQAEQIATLQRHTRGAGD